jgi:hypothetical protein
MNVMTNDLLSGLAAIRRRRLAAHGPALIWIVVVLAARLIFGTPMTGGVPVFLAITGLLGLVPLIFIGVSDLRCPRCANYFHQGPKYRNDFTRKCLNCGLSLRGTT